MFIKSVLIKNFRLFKEHFELTQEHIAIPNKSDNGSGLNVLVGENGVGKSSLLDAIALPLISYKSESIELNDFNEIDSSLEIIITSNEEFTVDKSMSGKFTAKGFRFLAYIRKQNSLKYPVGSIVSDTFFSPIDENSPKEGSPDLRVAVENPFKGSRFNDNDYLFVDKNRTKIMEVGTFSATRFDRLMDNLNFLYLRVNDKSPLQINETINSIINNGEKPPIENRLLKEAFGEFKEATGYEVSLNFIDNLEPYKKAFIGFTDFGNKQIPIEKIGSGYQMLLALMCHQKLSLQSGKELIVFIDEIELHLHPKIQKELVELLLTASKTAQIFITTHSPELLKDLQTNKKCKINVIVRNDQKIEINPLEQFVLPSTTVSETNFVAFNLASMEYFIELYNYLGEKHNKSTCADIDKLLGLEDIDLIEWKREDGTVQKLSKYSCMRNKFHHPSNILNDTVVTITYKEILNAVIFLRKKLKDRWL